MTISAHGYLLAVQTNRYKMFDFKKPIYQCIAWTCALTLMAGCALTPPPEPENIEFPTSSFSINPQKDTTVFGPEGTRIFIGSESLQFADGTPVTDDVTLELQEYYKPSDIILADLTTRAGDRLLETNGMVSITAQSAGNDVMIKPDKRIVVHFPKAVYDNRKMDLFYPDENATDSSVADWQVDSVNLVKRTLKLSSYGWWHPSSDDSTGYDFNPKDFADTCYYWNPLDYYVKAYDFSEATKKEIETTMNRNSFPKFDNWNDFGAECRLKISTEGKPFEISVTTNLSAGTKREIISFLKNLPQLEPGKNRHGEIIERRGLLFIQGGNVVPLYETDEAYLQSFQAKYAHYENAPIRSMDDAELNYYVFSVSKLGWINCDRFIDVDQKVDLLVQQAVDPNLTLKLAFSEINGVLKAEVVGGKYVFRNVPEGWDATIIGIQNEQGLFSTAFHELTISEQPVTDLAFESTSLGELRTRLERMQSPNEAI